jgi:hypothetical protein
LFKPEEALPILLMASMVTISKTKDYAEISLRSVFSSIDLKDTEMSKVLYKLIFNESYIFRDFPQREDQETTMLSAVYQVKIAEYLMRFECSATQHPLNQKFVFHCFFSTYGTEVLTACGLKYLSKE